MKFKKHPVITWSPETGDNFWYALSNGYIQFDQILTRDSARSVGDAFIVLRQFEEMLLEQATEQEEEE